MIIIGVQQLTICMEVEDIVRDISELAEEINTIEQQISYHTELSFSWYSNSPYFKVIFTYF